MTTTKPTNIDLGKTPGEIIKLSSALRWNNGVLEQAWQGVETGIIEWRPIPGNGPTTEQRLAALEEQVAMLRGFLNI